MPLLLTRVSELVFDLHTQRRAPAHFVGTKQQCHVVLQGLPRTRLYFPEQRRSEAVLLLRGRCLMVPAAEVAEALRSPFQGSCGAPFQLPLIMLFGVGRFVGTHMFLP